MDRSSSKRKACAFEVKVTLKKLRSDVASSETVPVLVLAPFQSHPKLTMENVKVGTTRRLQLSIFNPTSKEMIIELVNVPSEEDGFSFSDKQMRVAAENSVLLGVEWTPKHCLAARHVVGVRPLGQTRNLSEIVLIVSAPKPQGLRNRLMKQDQLAKTELKMKRRSMKPLSEKNDHLEPVFQTTEEDINERRTTFTVVKFKGQRSPAVAARTERKKQPHRSLFVESKCENLMQQINSRSRLPTATITAPAEETADLCSPLRNDQPETALTASTPSFYNKTFNLSNTSSPARSSMERFSTDSLEGVRNTQVERRMTRSAERLSLETVNIDSPTGIPLKPRSRCTRSAERINVDLFHQESLPDMEKRVSRPVKRRGCEETDTIDTMTTSKFSRSRHCICYRTDPKVSQTPLERSNSLDSLFIFDSPTEVSVKDDVFECRTSISPQPRSRCTRSAERSTVDLFHLESLPDMEKRVSRPVERRGREETDTMMTTSKFSRSRHRICYRTDPKVSQTPLERSNSLDSLFVFDSPTEVSVKDDVFECRTSISPQPRSRCTRSAERSTVDLFHLESLPDMEKRVSRPVERRGREETDTMMTTSKFSRSRHRICYRTDPKVSQTPLERSNSLDSLFVFDSHTEVSVKDDVFECRTSISPQPRSRCTRSAERSTVDLFHLESLPDMEKRVSRPVERRGREETDTMMTTSKFSRSRHRICYRTDPKVSQTPLERFNSLDSLFVFDSPTEVSVNDDVFECHTSISPQPCSRCTRSAERSTVDLFHLESLPDLKKKMSRPLQQRADDADLMTPSPSKRARPEKRGESSRCTRSVECVDLDLFNLDTPPSCAAVSKKQQRRSRSCLTVNDSRLDVRSFEDKLDQLSFSAINDDGNIDLKDTTLSTFTTRTIESQAVLDCNVLYPEKAASLDNVDGGKTNVAGSCVDRSGVDNVETGLPTALGVSPPKRRRTPKREAVASVLKREAYSVGNSAEASAVAMATRLRITVDDASASSSDGGGFWNVSPPKRLKLKPPSDSPVVLPPPSRVARRSTLKQRLSPGGGRTVVVRRRCESQSTAEEEAKPVASRRSAALNSGCATVGRPLPNKRQATNRTKVQSCLEKWEDAGILAKVLATSQQEYLDNLKRNKNKPPENVDEDDDMLGGGPSTSR